MENSKFHNKTDAADIALCVLETPIHVQVFERAAASSSGGARRSTSKSSGSNKTTGAAKSEAAQAFFSSSCFQGEAHFF